MTNIILNEACAQIIQLCLQNGDYIFFHCNHNPVSFAIVFSHLHRLKPFVMATFATCADLHRHPSTCNAELAAISFCANDNVDDELHGVPPATSHIFGRCQFLKVDSTTYLQRYNGIPLCTIKTGSITKPLLPCRVCPTRTCANTLM